MAEFEAVEEKKASQWKKDRLKKKKSVHEDRAALADKKRPCEEGLKSEVCKGTPSQCFTALTS